MGSPRELPVEEVEEPPKLVEEELLLVVREELVVLLLVWVWERPVLRPVEEEAAESPVPEKARVRASPAMGRNSETVTKLSLRRRKVLSLVGTSNSRTRLSTKRMSTVAPWRRCGWFGVRG